MVIAVLIIMGYATAGHYNVKLPGWGIPACTLVPCTLLYITYYLGGWKNKFTNFLGKISYEFYIVYGFIVMLLGNCHILRMAIYINTIIMIVLVFGLITFIAWILSKLCTSINNAIK